MKRDSRNGRFLQNETLWQEIWVRSQAATSIKAAVAYIGSDVSSLAHFKKDDSLVANLSLQAVSRGATNPSELLRLQKRGVVIMNSELLHAKFRIFDDQTLIVSSANLSSRSRYNLLEAGVITTDRASVGNAKRYFESLNQKIVTEDELQWLESQYHAPESYPDAAASRPRKVARNTIPGITQFMRLSPALRERISCDQTGPHHSYCRLCVWYGQALSDGKAHAKTDLDDRALENFHVSAADRKKTVRGSSRPVFLNLLDFAKAGYTDKRFAAKMQKDHYRLTPAGHRFLAAKRAHIPLQLIWPPVRRGERPRKR